VEFTAAPTPGGGKADLGQDAQLPLEGVDGRRDHQCEQDVGREARGAIAARTSFGVGTNRCAPPKLPGSTTLLERGGANVDARLAVHSGVDVRSAVEPGAPRPLRARNQQVPVGPLAGGPPSR
jgi:hypothetical protein